MINPKTVLVTGANGFVGSHLCLALARKKMKVIGLTHTKSRPFNYRSYPPHQFIQVVGDIRDRKLLEEIFSQYHPNYCFHLAAKATVEEGQDDPSQTYDVNINGAVNILELSRIHKVEKIIIASTSHVYGDNPNVPYKEEYFPQPSRPYETSKTCVDLIAQSYADSYNMPIEIPRFVNIYGPGDANFTRLIPNIMKQIITTGKVEIWGGNVIRDFLYIDDAIQAYMSLLSLKTTAKNKIINFGTGKPMHVFQLVKRIVKLSGKKVSIEIIRGAERQLEVEKQYVSLNKAYKNFHWKATIQLNCGLLETHNWYKKYLSC